MIKVSIVIPVYNVENYLKKCLDSIINQTYTNIEIIIIDDGSTDASIEICNMYANDFRVKIIRSENCGVANARNLGVEVATGQYITFVDSDDWIESDFVENMLDKIKKTNSDILFSNCYDVNENEVNINKSILKEELQMGYEFLYYDFFDKKRHAFSIWGKLFKSEILKNKKFKNLKYGEDTLFLFELLNKKSKIYLTEYAGYYYLNRATGAMNTLNNYQKSCNSLFGAKIILEKGLTLKNKKIKRLCQKKITNDLFWYLKSALNFGISNKEIISKIKETSYYKKVSVKGIVIYIYSLNISCFRFVINKLVKK